MGYYLCLAHDFISHRLARSLKFARPYCGRGNRRNRSTFALRIVRLHLPYNMVSEQAQEIAVFTLFPRYVKIMTL